MLNRCLISEPDNTMESVNLRLRDPDKVIQDDTDSVSSKSQYTLNDQCIRPARDPNTLAEQRAAGNFCNRPTHRRSRITEVGLVTKNSVQAIEALEPQLESDVQLHETGNPTSYTIEWIETEQKPFSVIVFQNRVFLGQIPWNGESCDTEDTGDVADCGSKNDLLESGRKSELKKAAFMNIKQDDQFFLNTSLDKLGTKLLLKGAKSVKTRGKRQRHKKSDVPGVWEFNICDYFKPAPVYAAVFPMSRESKRKGQISESAGESSKEPPPPPQPPPRDESRKWPPDSLYDLPWSTFRQELFRLGTFMNLPVNTPVYAVRLAEAGFLRFPDGAIICYFCGLQRDEWNAGESPVDVHRRLRGDCPMVTGAAACENQPVDTLSEERLQELMEVWSLSGPPLVPGREPAQRQRAVEVADAVAVAPQQTTSRAAHPSAFSAGRAATAPAVDLAANSQPSVPTAARAGAQASAPTDRQASQSQSASAHQSNSGASASLAQAGGNNSGQARNQQAPRMGLLGGDAASANPAAPRGPIFDGTAQPEPPRNQADELAAAGSEARAGQQVVTYQQLGIVTEAPKRPDMAMINARVGSFRNWPATASHTPLQLAEAGFYYAGYADCGRCFFCGGGLKSWEPNDNPWVEHARWFAKCAYVRQCQGQDFIDVVQELNVNSCPITLNQVTEEINRRRADGERIQEPVVDPAITSILELGVRQEDVDSAVLRVQREGHLVTADRLFDTLQEEGALAAGGGDVSSISDSELGQVEELVTENSEIRQQHMCKICLDKESCIVFLPCGHLVSCAECSPALKHCPMCRQRVKGRVRAFPA